MAGIWTILSEDGEIAINFTSFLTQDFVNGSKVSNYPIERGKFSSYNKTQNPFELVVSLGIEGDSFDIAEALDDIIELQEEAIKVIVITPTEVYDSVTLEEYSFQRSNTENIGMLAIDLKFQEIREGSATVTTSIISDPRNGTSADTVDTGRVTSQSALREIQDYISRTFPDGGAGI